VLTARLHAVDMSRKPRTIGKPCLSRGGQRALIVFVLLIGGCTQESGQGPSEELGTVRQETLGPVALTLSVTPDTLEPSQHARIAVEILAEPGVTIHEQDYRQVLSEGDSKFEQRIVDSRTERATPTDDGKLRWRSEFDLEFFLPGEYELPPAKVSFVDTRKAGTASASTGDGSTPEEQTVATEPITVVVRAAEDGQLSEAELRDLGTPDPKSLPREWGVWIWLGPLCALVGIILLVWFVRKLRRQHAEAAARIPAHVWAEGQIAALLAEDLIGKRRIQEFYYRISDIVRGYIERRFGVHAPEMTTEEFLIAAALDNRFGTNKTFELDRFLNACDLVKYARYDPGPGESDTMLVAAREFIERTREDFDSTAATVAGDPRTEDQAA